MVLASRLRLFVLALVLAAGCSSPAKTSLDLCDVFADQRTAPPSADQRKQCEHAITEIAAAVGRAPLQDFARCMRETPPFEMALRRCDPLLGRTDAPMRRCGDRDGLTAFLVRLFELQGNACVPDDPCALRLALSMESRVHLSHTSDEEYLQVTSYVAGSCSAEVAGLTTYCAAGRDVGESCGYDLFACNALMAAYPAGAIRCHEVKEAWCSVDDPRSCARTESTCRAQAHDQKSECQRISPTEFAKRRRPKRPRGQQGRSLRPVSR